MSDPGGTRINSLPQAEVLATKNLASVYEDLKQTVLRAVRVSQRIHEVEKAIWEQLLRLGREALAQVFALLGNGDRAVAIEWTHLRSDAALPAEATSTTSHHPAPADAS
jgi:hypothetical protein